MNAPVLLYGRRATPLPVAATALDLDAADTVVLSDVQIGYVLFEFPMRSAEALLPQSLHPSVPAVLGVTFVRADDGPLGTFILAYVGIACRTGIKPRHMITRAWCNQSDAGAWFAARYGFDVQPATVSYAETYDRCRGTVETDGLTELDVATTSTLPLVGSGATVKYSPPLNAARVGDHDALVQFEAAYEFRRVLRGVPQAHAFNGPTILGPCADNEAPLRPTHPISGTHANVDLHLLPVRFEVDLETPAEAGGARKIAR